jgi:hypothetical protein
MARPLEPGDRPLDPIALAVTHRIDQGRPATSWSTSGSGLLLVGPLGLVCGGSGAGATVCGRWCSCRPVVGQMRWPLVGPTRARSQHPDRVQRPMVFWQHGQQAWCRRSGQATRGPGHVVAALARGRGRHAGTSPEAGRPVGARRTSGDHRARRVGRASLDPDGCRGHHGASMPWWGSCSHGRTTLRWSSAIRPGASLGLTAVRPPTHWSCWAW